MLPPSPTAFASAARPHAAQPRLHRDPRQPLWGWAPCLGTGHRHGLTRPQPHTRQGKGPGCKSTSMGQVLGAGQVQQPHMGRLQRLSTARRMQTLHLPAAHPAGLRGSVRPGALRSLWPLRCSRQRPARSRPLCGSCGCKTETAAAASRVWPLRCLFQTTVGAGGKQPLYQIGRAHV